MALIDDVPDATRTPTSPTMAQNSEKPSKDKDTTGFGEVFVLAERGGRVLVWIVIRLGGI